jgi:hypothetical protein
MKYDRITYPGRKDLGTISPCTKFAVLGIEAPVVVFFEFNMTTLLLARRLCVGKELKFRMVTDK